VDIHFPPAGIFHNFAFFSIDKRFPLHARKVMHGCWGFGQLALTKFLVIVDKDVDVRNEQEVLWILGNHVDPERDVEIVRGPLDILDHAAPVAGAGSKMGFDATRKWTSEGARAPYPEAVATTPEIAGKILRRWKEYGL
ncbi:MAG: menaquinone biosynthesis decarboxylase, partial [Planctomycetota bacterium]